MILNTYLKAKVREIEITDARLDYEGSLTLDEDIMDAMGVYEYEQVFVHSKHTKNRIMTYFLAGPRGTKICQVNGGATQHFKKGDIVHLLVFAQSDRPIKPVII